jgi:hypothetical protein
VQFCKIVKVALKKLFINKFLSLKFLGVFSIENHGFVCPGPCLNKIVWKIEFLFLGTVCGDL